jgi:glycosyltransferase involved in cell wall biosynthesis
MASQDGGLNILFVCPYTPNLIRTRSHHLLTNLVRRGHRLTLASVWQAPADLDVLQSFREQGVTVLASRLTRARSAANVLRALGSGRPLQARFCWEPALARQLQKALAGTPTLVDVIHVEHLRAVEYGLLARRAPGPQRRTPIVWDSVDCISMLFELAMRHSRTRFGRWATRFELPATRRYEGWATRQFDQVLVTSSVDRAALEQLAAAVPGQHGPLAHPIRVLANGVDLDHFQPPQRPREPATVVLSGKMSYHANVTAAHQLVGGIMPIVWATDPTVKVVLVGSTPSPDVRALEKRYAPLVTVTGHVPDVRPYLQSATLAAAPMAYGAGIQNKVLEAMACGTATVASPSAIAALPESARQALLVAEGDAASAAAIVLLLHNPARRADLEARGRAYVSEHFDWVAVAVELEKIYDGLLS